ncbi:MAG: Gfo/Idh/MocA family oxidoreductase [Lentisphaeria bacterium]|nr:Gfo/Idh/MocA family oxidoreductase [Lentisphaeria bacterium]
MSKLRVGIIGTGGRGINCFGKNLVEQHQDDVEIVAMADRNLPRARKGRDLLGIQCDLHDNAADLAARKDVDAVFVTTIDSMHEEHALEVLENDKHVYIEKPLAITVEGCLKVIEASKRHDKVLTMGFNLRYNAVVHRLRELIEQDMFGRLFSIQAIEHYSGGRTYHSRWNRLKEHTGGLFIHKGSHDFDVINYLMGVDVRPARVACFANVFTLKKEALPFEKRPGIEPGPRCATCPYNTECPDVFLRNSPLFDEETAAVDGYWPDQCMYLSDKDTHDQGIAIIEYDNGATASHSEYFATPISNRHYLLEGTNGRGEGDFHSSMVTCRPRWSTDEIIHKIGPRAGGHGGSDPDIIQSFLDCIRTGKKPRASAIDGIWSVAIGVAAEKARAENRVVEISDLMDVDSDLLKDDE